MRQRFSVFSLVVVTLLLPIPLLASQFVELPFDRVAREAELVVRGKAVQTWTAWDDAGEVIFTYATVRVSRYFGETTGPDLITIREVGGAVGNFRQEAIGFPEIREGEDVVLMLSRWDGRSEYRIHAYNQGKYLVRMIGRLEMLVQDPIKQGDQRLRRFLPRGDATAAPDAEVEGLEIGEFAKMIDAARAGETEQPFDRRIH
jgi:hypothetical protein